MFATIRAPTRHWPERDHGIRFGLFPLDTARARELLIRLANVPSGLDQSGATVNNTGLENNRVQGSYVYAPTVAELSSSFVRVASFVAELAY